ncbi:MAG TPA: glycine zipper 2TM domain-containing protein, partial [Mycobacterium sp.]|nr:glycine zipper 2TM domain-containing protein [Mycobacterium sp.]
LTAPAVVAWAAFLGWINLHATWASWMANVITVVILTVFAVGELVADKLPKTPARTAPPSFIGRIILGAFAGAVIGTAWGYRWGGLGAGVIGAVLGTLGGYHARKRLVAARSGQDLPIALLEDAVAILGGFAILAVTAGL